MASVSSAGARIQPYIYQDSTIANYEEYELYAAKRGQITLITTEPLGATRSRGR